MRPSPFCGEAIQHQCQVGGSQQCRGILAVIVKDSISNAEVITTENKKRGEEGNNYVADTAKVLKEIMEYEQLTGADTRRTKEK